MYDDECNEVLKRQNAARQTMINRYKRINKEEYDEKRKTYRICRNKKKRQVEEKRGGNTTTQCYEEQWKQFQYANNLTKNMNQEI